MKSIIRNSLQRLFGFKNYLFIFSLYNIRKIEKGKYEREFTYFIKMIENSGIILDIGANIGITAVPLAKGLRNADIHAYEPISENFSTLLRIKEYLKLRNLMLFNLALGNQEGTLKMIMPIVGNARMQGLSKAFLEESNEKGIMYDVPLRKLDDLYQNEKRIKAIKIDVENFEFEVLKGSKNLLKRNKPIIYCELWDNENRQLVFDLLKSIGYKTYIYDFQSDSLKLFVCSDTNLYSNNFFFVFPIVSKYNILFGQKVLDDISEKFKEQI